MLRQAKLTLSDVANVGLVVFLVIAIVFGVRGRERRIKSLLEGEIWLLEKSVNRWTLLLLLLLTVVLVPGSAVVEGLLGLLGRVVSTAPSHFGYATRFHECGL